MSSPNLFSVNATSASHIALTTRCFQSLKSQVGVTIFLQPPLTCCYKKPTLRWHPYHYYNFTKIQFRVKNQALNKFLEFPLAEKWEKKIRQNAVEKWLINVMSIHQGLFYAKRLGNSIHCKVIFTFFVNFFLRCFFALGIIKYEYFQDRSNLIIDWTLTHTTSQGQSLRRSNGNERVLNTLQIFINGASTSDAV